MMTRRSMWKAIEAIHERQCHDSFMKAVNGQALLASQMWTPAMTRREKLIRYARRIGAI